MRKLGVSIYPERSNLTEDKQYLKLASVNGFSRVFTCLISADKPKNVLVQEFKEIIGYAKSLEMEVILDVTPGVFDRLGISYDDLSLFHELGADGLRLDAAFDGQMEAGLSYNPYNLKIELNLSNDIDYLHNILSHKPNMDNIIGCHNFYPQKYTGLPYQFFINCSKRFKDKGLRTAAFVSSQSGKYGPWDINEGLCTLEEHRELPIHIQAKHLWATDLIDDVIIGNAYASEAELIKLGRLNRYILELEVSMNANITTVERQAIQDEKHVRRGDISDYVIRSTAIRGKYADKPIHPEREADQKTGDIMIGNDTFGKYKGELQIVLQDMPADSRKNKVATIVPDELFLLEQIGPWATFKLVEA